MYNCLLIDDEKHVLDLLETYINKTEHLQVKHRIQDPMKALDLLAIENYDIVFCDVSMPEILGTEIIKTYKNKTLFIICTGFKKYAVESFDLEVVDFLVKPIRYPRFMQAVQRALDILKSKKAPINNEVDYIFIKTEQKGKLEKVNFSDIIYIEASNNYTCFVLKNKKLLSSFSLKDLEEKLSANKFIRVHKSFIIAISQIIQVDTNGLLLNNINQNIPIGLSYKEVVYDKLRIK
jgi:two-component system, LytTR family, response regulator